MNIVDMVVFLFLLAVIAMATSSSLMACVLMKLLTRRQGNGEGRPEI